MAVAVVQSIQPVQPVAVVRMIMPDMVLLEDDEALGEKDKMVNHVLKKDDGGCSVLS